jgi:GNAT superfamily N-acetyltransferase
MEVLSEPHVPAVARLLAAALEDDPGYAFLFPDPAARRAGLQDLFERNLRTHLPHRCTHVLHDDSGHPLATVTVRPPGGVPISLWTMVRRGLIPFALRHGPVPVRRLLRLKGIYDRIEDAIAGGRPHFHVHMMAVAPRHQGRGIGSSLLEQALAQSAAGHGSNGTERWPTVLTTNDAANEGFYRRAGFHTVEVRRIELAPGHPAHDCWCMRRD